MFGQEHIKPIIDHNFRFYVQTLYLFLRKIRKSCQCIVYIVCVYISYIYALCRLSDFVFFVFYRRCYCSRCKTKRSTANGSKLLIIVEIICIFFDFTASEKFAFIPISISILKNESDTMTNVIEESVAHTSSTMVNNKENLSTREQKKRLREI